MIRFFLGAAFARWGCGGAIVAFLLLIAAAYFLLTSFAWLINGVLEVVGLLSGLGYVLLAIVLVRWLRGRMYPTDHLLNRGRRRRWLD